tara:strand:- start:50 stop:2062 length:2013 start_codon:yes stop_codon:yes gene_type:complete
MAGLTLNDFAPEAGSLAQKEYELSSLLNTMGQQALINKSGETYRNPTFGVDQVVNVWVQQQAAFRQHMIQDIQQISQSVEEVRSPVNHIISEIFRRGVTWRPKFSVKCSSCETEYKNKPETCTTATCSYVGKADTLIEPDVDQYEKLQAFTKDCNVFDQTLEDVLREFWWDVNTIDDGFIYFAKEYKDYGEKVRSKVISVERLNPALIEYDLDKATGVPKALHYVCYIHRDEGAASEVPQGCDACGKAMVPAMFTYRYRGKEVYLLDSEVLHVSKFMPTRTYGWSPILTLFDKVLTIIGMDKTLYRYFFERKMPASMILISTDDPDSLRAERERVEQEIRQNPEYIPMIAVSNESQRGKVDMIRLFHNLQEMDYLPVRQEIRERISAMWGVTPAWQGAPEGFGGLSTQTQQLVVMSRVVEGDQRIFHEKVFPIILEMFGITDWTLELLTPEEKAEATQLQFVQQKVMVASQLLQDGYDVKLKSMDSGIMNLDFEISGKGLGPKEQMEMQQEQQQQMMGGGMEGMGMSMEGMPDGMGEAQQGVAQPPSAEGQPGLGGAGRDQTGQMAPNVPELQASIQNALNKNYSGTKTMMKQIIDKGHIPEIQDVTDDMAKMWFKSSGDHYVASFNKTGDLMGIETAHFPKPPEERAVNKFKNAIYEPDKLNLDGLDDL